MPRPAPPSRVVFRAGETPQETLVVELNVPRGTELPERVTVKEAVRPSLLKQMVEAAQVQKITLEQFLSVSSGMRACVARRFPRLPLCAPAPEE